MLTTVISYHTSSNAFKLAGELFFVTDRGSGFWNIYKWVSSFISTLELF
jgi:hypothetical protein